MCGMFLLRRVTDEKYLWVSSVIGAVLHNTGQIMVAVVMLKTAAVFSFFPFLLISGCIAGAFTGICAQILCSRINL